AELEVRPGLREREACRRVQPEPAEVEIAACTDRQALDPVVAHQSRRTEPPRERWSRRLPRRFIQIPELLCQLAHAPQVGVPVRVVLVDGWRQMAAREQLGRVGRQLDDQLATAAVLAAAGALVHPEPPW